ncbi:SDR family oxidoreductase [uncultured Hydrogenophaga sp.]|uniref:UDP-glucose 4-epimerase family protein n=1 Tax=uncultured Hydrogenophaga sp. TaxID=199683 RepID=UPI00265F1F22|nr:SDR family oxidoreductase [uncultured Hydrogenophaga sp.]
MSWLITGGTGFVGQALTRRALAEGKDVRLALRRPFEQGAAQGLMVGQIDSQTAWQGALEGVDTIFHLAARVHVMNETATDPLTAFRAVNTAGTLNLARQAAAAGVRRLVFLSSIKVNGEHTAPGRPFAANLPGRPEDPYGQSKWEAEQGLQGLARETGLEVVVVRPPLVYGPGVRANFAALIRAVHRGWPLPLASVTGNRRSLVALDNLVDLLVTCADHPAAAQQTFLVSDGDDLSTAELLLRMASALGRSPRLLPFPPALLRLGAATLGRQAVVQRLLDNLQVDITHTRQTLGWQPPITVDEGLRRTVAGLRTP